MTEKPRNVAASVRQRLLNRARAEQQDSQRLLVRYAIERLLYRLSQSRVRDRFILKGAMLFAVWSPQPFRSTGDLDLLGSGANDPDALRDAFAAICRQQVADDGLLFDADSIRIETLREDEEYQGARVRLDARLGAAVIAVQIDIGFGDAVHPAPQQIDYPSLLEDFPSARIRAYPPETVIAEKLEAMVRFGDLTSRLKDHYDIWILSRTFPFSKVMLVTAMTATFAQRGTARGSSMPIPLTLVFAARPDKLVQWNTFLRRTAPVFLPPPFAGVIEDLQRFVAPLLSAAGDATETGDRQWTPLVGWGKP